MLQQTDYCNIYRWDALHCNWRELGCEVAIEGKCVATNVRGGVAMDGQGSVATNAWQEGVATNSRIREVLQRMGGRCCNEWERQDGKDATGHCNISQWMDYRE